ncbi:hypothetical protein PCI56_07520 [Plesiomonas shigelloides subsp. oncorhynchi]|nr:hypothetical protein [Plesiomonas shigelloides]
METDEQTIDMFGEQLNSSMLSDTINIIENEKSARWPETMRELYDLFSCTVEKHGGSPELALVMLSELCRVYGGLQFYLPRGKTLQNTIRDLRCGRSLTVTIPLSWRRSSMLRSGKSGALPRVCVHLRPVAASLTCLEIADET